VRQVIHYLC